MQARVMRIDRVGGLDDRGVGNVLDPNVAGAVHDGCTHRSFSRVNGRHDFNPSAVAMA